MGILSKMGKALEALEEGMSLTPEEQEQRRQYEETFKDADKANWQGYDVVHKFPRRVYPKGAEGDTDSDENRMSFAPPNPEFVFPGKVDRLIRGGRSGWDAFWGKKEEKIS